MADKKQDNGISYALQILNDRWQPTMIFWLGFRPLTINELSQLMPDLTRDRLDSELAVLQNLRVVNPIKDTENKYSLTDDGEDFRQLMNSLSIWGQQQIDDNDDVISSLIVEPETDAKLSDLVKYTKLIKKYLG